LNKELPQGWEWTSLDSIADIILGQSPPSSTYNEDKIGLPFYQGKSEFGSIYPTPSKWCSSPKKIAEKGYILISIRAPVGPTNICSETSCIGRGLAAICGLDDIDTKFIFYLLRNFQEQFRYKATGTTFEAISGNTLRNFEIPVPPLAEQQRIVNKIEELFTNLDKGIEYLKTAQAELKLTRQSVLKYALEGRLTEDWREKHKDKIEPASVLLENIKAERRKEGKYKDLPPIDTSGNTSLPDDWAWTRLGEVISIEYGKGLTEDKRDKNGKYPVYGSSGIVGYHSNYYVEKNCIVIGRKGAVGKVHLTNSPCWPIDTTYYTISPKELSMNFLFYLLSHMRLEKLDKSTAIPGINRNDVYSKVIILPSLAEQNKIVEVIENYYSILDNMENTISQSLNQTSGIRQSILKKAFEGRLVPQDPNDEPASVLLERIKADKSKSEKEKISEKKNRFVKEKYRQMRID